MTTRARHAHAPAWVLALLAAVLTLALGVFTAGPASAAPTPGTETRVGAFASAAPVPVGPSTGITAGQRLGKDLAHRQIVVATGVAANTAGSAVVSRASALQGALPAGSRGRVTMAVGVGEDASGSLRTVVGTSEPNGYLRPGVSLNPGEELATGAGHAEASILDYMSTNGIRPQMVGAGRRICPACASLLDRVRVVPATALKVPQ